MAQLNAPVETLHQLKATLELLHHITDLQNVIDNMYYPVEELYQLLRYINNLKYIPGIYVCNSYMYMSSMICMVECTPSKGM